MNHQLNHFIIRLGKESFKFSSTHFTLFSADSAERLHGHNYQVAIECDLSTLGDLGMGFEFNSLKPLVKELTERWDERVLIPKLSPLIRIEPSDVSGEPHVVVSFAKRSYRFPADDTVLLETVNITSEELARIFAQDLAMLWRDTLSNEATSGAGVHGLATRVLRLRVTIEETRGQSATFSFENPLPKTTTPQMEKARQS